MFERALTRLCVAGRPCPASPPLKTPRRWGDALEGGLVRLRRPRPWALPQVPRRVLRGVAPAAYRRHRNVKRLLKSLEKTFSQDEKGKMVSEKASATGWGDLRVRRVRRQLPQRHRACVPRPGLSRAWLGGPAVSGWYLALAITSNLSLLAPVFICHCAVCYRYIATA